MLEELVPDEWSFHLGLSRKQLKMAPRITTFAVTIRNAAMIINTIHIR